MRSLEALIQTLRGLEASPEGPYDRPMSAAADARIRAQLSRRERSGRRWFAAVLVFGALLLSVHALGGARASHTRITGSPEDAGGVRLDVGAADGAAMREPEQPDGPRALP
ncbi:MAG: hypothetical protein IT384_00850 [Deltaproteobacteria bacterium]|nr:hypothetical protein [Deltaproteobacteria bacterium]